MQLRAQALELYVGGAGGGSKLCVNMKLMQMTDVVPSCPEGTPFGPMHPSSLSCSPSRSRPQTWADVCSAEL